MNIILPLIILAIMLVSAVGWIANIIQIVALTDAPVTTMFIFKCIGVIAVPIGAVLGYLGMWS